MVTTVAPKVEIRADAQAVLDLAEKAIAPGSPVLDLLRGLVATLDRGEEAVLAGKENELTPNVAAAFVGMSRPHLLAFMDAGALEFTRVGTHRRIKMCDLLDFKERRQAAEKALAQARGDARRAQVPAVAFSDAALAALDEL